MTKQDWKDMWVYIEHDGKTVAPVGLELCCEIRRLCDQTGDKLAAVILGDLREECYAKIAECGVDRILAVTGTGYDEYSTEAYAGAFTLLANKYHPSAIFVGGTTNGRDFAPRFSVQLNTGCTSDAMELRYNPDTGDIHFIEPAVGGKIIAEITVPSLRPQVGTIRPGTFRYAPTGQRTFDIVREQIDFPLEHIRTKRLSYAPDAYDPALNIEDAGVIVCVGNGLADADHLPRYRKLAALLGGKLGCTRPLFDREILPYKLQIGQSGAMVKPKLYICFGVSGAVNHMAGVSADMVIAVNADPAAQIFSYCDYGIVGDMDEVCDAMVDEIAAQA